MPEQQRTLSTDLLVLGAGPGGYTAAFRAADLGRRVVLVDAMATLGGVCLNVGCIPSKALLHAARVVTEAQEMAGRGIAFGAPAIDRAALVHWWKDEVVARLTGGLAELARRRRVEVVRGTGTFTGPHALAVTGDDGPTEVRFGQAIIAAGSRPVELPGLPHGDPRVLDSSAALELPAVGGELLVIGGGIVGLEMAAFHHAFGTRVTVVELSGQLLPGVDADLVQPLHRRIAGRYAGLHLNTRVKALDATDQGLTAWFEGEAAPECRRFDHVLVAVGRRPNSDRIGAAQAGVRVDERGFIPVDREQRSNVPHIFAIGDIVGPPMLAHKASHQGVVAAEVAVGRRAAFDARALPAVAYTDPEVAWAGLTEQEAKRQGLDYGKGVFPWAASGRSLALGRDDGLTKLLFERAGGRVVGVGLVGPGAGELVAEAVVAIEMGADAADLALSIHPHPTLSETLGFAAQAYAGTITDLYVPRR